jgi:hypothetical protein
MQNNGLFRYPKEAKVNKLIGQLNEERDLGGNKKRRRKKRIKHPTMTKKRLKMLKEWQKNNVI